MNINELKDSLPESAKDIKLNLSTVLTEEGSPGLNQKQIYSIALACSYATKNLQLANILLSEGQLSTSEIEAVQSAAIIMAMNNIYYRFTHLVSDKSYANMPAKLRMNVIANPGIAKIDYELNCLAVSAINGCAICMDSHISVLVKANLDKTAIQSIIRIAAVINATALSLDITK